MISLASMGFWEFWGREMVSYEEILVLKEAMQEGSLLTKEDFKIMKVENPSREALRVKHLEKLLGMETKQYVAENVELRMEYFSESEYLIGEETGKAAISLSTDWLISVPQTIARGDKVCMYRGKKKIGECMISHVRDSSNNEILFSQRDRQTASGIVTHIEIISELGTLLSIMEEASKGERLSMVII